MIDRYTRSLTSESNLFRNKDNNNGDMVDLDLINDNNGSINAKWILDRFLKFSDKSSNSSRFWVGLDINMDL